MSQPLRVLLVEDEENDEILIRHALERGGFTLTLERLETPVAMQAALEQKLWDVIIADYNLPNKFNGLQALKLLQQQGLDIPFIIVSGYIGEDTAVEAMRAGANDYVMKDKLARLAPAVHREIQEAEIRRARRSAETKLQTEYALRANIEKTIPSGIAIWNLQGRFTYVNPAFCNLVGIPEHILIEAKPPYEFWPAAEKKSYEERFWKLMRATEDLVSSEIHLRRRDGQDICVLVSCTRMRDENETLTGWLASFTDITLRKRAEDALQQLNAELEQRVHDRTAALNQALLDLRKAIAARKKLETELLDIVEKERRKLGLELHDDLGQRLSGLLFMTKALALKLKQKRLSLASDAANINNHIQDAIQLAKHLARDMFSSGSQGVALPEALKKLAKQIKNVFQVGCVFQSKGVIPPLAPEKEMHLYKIAQEASHNGIKHGKARKIQITLIGSEKQLTLAVKNDGKPFPAIEKLSAGAGIRIMNYRAHVIGGSLEIRPVPAGGTEVICTVPP